MKNRKRRYVQPIARKHISDKPEQDFIEETMKRDIARERSSNKRDKLEDDLWAWQQQGRPTFGIPSAKRQKRHSLHTHTNGERNFQDEENYPEGRPDGLQESVDEMTARLIEAKRYRFGDGVLDADFVERMRAIRPPWWISEYLKV
jgi:hypothetical protein